MTMKNNQKRAGLSHPKKQPKLALVPMYTSGDPPLGLGSIATYLKEYLDFKNTVIIDTDLKTALRILEDEKPDIIGLSAFTMHYGKAIRFARAIRNSRKLKNLIIIVGGVHISTLPESLDPVFDFGVIGEGEETMREFMSKFMSRFADSKKTGQKFSKKDFAQIPGLAFYDSRKFVLTPKRDLIQPLDKIPIVDRDFFSDRYFKKSILETKKAVRLTGMLTSRGCPYKCRFCSTSQFWQTIRFNSVARVVDEIDYLVNKKNIEFISIWDDLFLINKTRLKEIIAELDKRGLIGKVKFNGMARANLINDELCRLAKKLGVVFFNFGFESGSDRMIKYLKRDSVTLKDNMRAVRLCHKYGISVGAALIIGSPTETEKDIKATIEFIKFMKKYSNVDLVWMSIMAPLPGTEMWEIASKRGKVSNSMKDWSVLSEYALQKPLLLDDAMEYDRFMELFKEARKHIRFFELRLWLRRLWNDPFLVSWLIIKDMKFLKFFSLERAEGKIRDFE